MTRISIGFVAVLVSLGLATACNKPSDASCRKAISNLRALIGTDSPTSNTDIEGDIRRCKGGSTKKAVDCAAKATSLDELRACDFMKVPARAAGTPSDASPTSGSGSATGAAPTGTPTGSAGSSADATTGAGSAVGSAAAGSGADVGSAGSGATGSANAGSATN